MLSPPSVYQSRARLLMHPGPMGSDRMQTAVSEKAQHIRVTIAPGTSLHDGLLDALDVLGARCASTTVLGGFFSKVVYCVAPPDASGRVVCFYSAPIDAGPSTLIFGNATIARGSNDKPVVHCHASISTSEGNVRGGHLLTDQCIVTEKPCTVFVTTLEEFDLQLEYDPETNIQLIKPTGVSV